MAGGTDLLLHEPLIGHLPHGVNTITFPFQSCDNSPWQGAWRLMGKKGNLLSRQQMGICLHDLS